MGFLDRLLGREDADAGRQPPRAQAPQRTDDEIAIERYRYLLRTAPPETIEQVHAEAFAKLTPEQRRQVYDELKQGAEPPVDDQPGSLARSATRAEMRNPGSMERTFGGMGGGGAMRGGPSFGSMVGSSILGTVAGYVIGSALVGAFMPDAGYNDASGDNGDSGSDGGDSGSGDSGAGDSGAGDSGGDFGGDSGWGGGGGDFGGFGGGGDFGGGDFGGGFDV